MCIRDSSQYGVDAGRDGWFDAWEECVIDSYSDEEELHWLIEEETDWEDDPLLGYDGFLEELTDEAIDGIDLFTSVMHDQGHIVGLEDIQEASEIDGFAQHEIAISASPLPAQPSIAVISDDTNETVIDEISLRDAINDARDKDAATPVAVVEKPAVIAAEVSSALLRVEQTTAPSPSATVSLTKEQVEALAIVAAQRLSLIHI